MVNSSPLTFLSISSGSGGKLKAKAWFLFFLTKGRTLGRQRGEGGRGERQAVIAFKKGTKMTFCQVDQHRHLKQQSSIKSKVLCD